MASIQRCCCSTGAVVKSFPARSALLALMVAAVAGIALTAVYHPSVYAFLTSRYGLITLGGAALVGVASIAWIFSPLCRRGQQGAKTEEASHPSTGQEWTEDEVTACQKNWLIPKETPYEEPFEKNSVVTKFFHTQLAANLATAPVGDYAFQDFGPLQLLIIHNGSSQIKALVRKSQSCPGLYRIVTVSSDRRNYQESSLVFSPAQISGMLRMKCQPPSGFRLSVLNKAFKSKEGIVIFTKDEEPKQYFLVNRLGALEAVSNEDVTRLVHLLNRRL